MHSRSDCYPGSDNTSGVMLYRNLDADDGGKKRGREHTSIILCGL